MFNVKFYIYVSFYSQISISVEGSNNGTSSRAASLRLVCGTVRCLVWCTILWATDKRQQPKRNALCTISDVLVQVAHKHSGFWSNPGLIGELRGQSEKFLYWWHTICLLIYVIKVTMTFLMPKEGKKNIFEELPLEILVRCALWFLILTCSFWILQNVAMALWKMEKSVIVGR